MMENRSGKKRQVVRAVVDPGICGFPAIIHARRKGRWQVGLEIRSGCQHIQRLGESLKSVSMKELFSPLSRNPIFNAAERSGCHTSCVIPVGVVKAAEVALEMALPRDVRIRFEP